MIQSRNKILGKKKYYNVQKGKKDNTFFFVLPSILISPKKFLHWDTVMFSIFAGWGKYYIQYNIFETVKDTSTEVLREDMSALLAVLKSENLYLSTDPKIKSMHELLEFLNKNPYLIHLVKNANLNHLYVKSIINSYIKEQPFIVQK